jgi:adenosylcobyric acid synthase
MEKQDKRNVMVLGTASDVGKGLIATALCRWLHRGGVNVAPFKAMNPGERGTGSVLNPEQAYQALAAQARPNADMNPILVNFTNMEMPRFSVLGELPNAVDSLSLDVRADVFRSVVKNAYERLAAQHSFIVIEGCGSPVEINLLPRDFANLWLATEVKAQCILVANAESGGAYAAVAGTLSLMTAEQRKLIAGILINKFHGPVDDFRRGMLELEARLGIPCVGIIPYLPGLRFLNEDDGGALPDQSRQIVRQGTEIHEEQLREIDRWTDHVVAHIQPDFLGSLLH